jgi:hypothetical protein
MSGGKVSELFLFMAQDDIRGIVSIEPPRAKSRLEHMGIKIELIGRIGLCRWRLCRRSAPRNSAPLMRARAGTA